MAGWAKGGGNFVRTPSGRVAVSVHVINVSRVSTVCCIDNTPDVRGTEHVSMIPKSVT